MSCDDPEIRLVKKSTTLLLCKPARFAQPVREMKIYKVPASPVLARYSQRHGELYLAISPPATSGQNLALYRSVPINFAKVTFLPRPRDDIFAALKH
jgi:hypothetical protein